MSMLLKSQILPFLTIVVAALLAGTSWGIWMGQNPSTYPYETYLAQQQNLVQSLHKPMIILVIVAILLCLALAYLNKSNQSLFSGYFIAALCFIACMLITRFGNLPLQQKIFLWTPDSMPDGWMWIRDRWWNHHKQRTVAELIALVLITWTSLRNRTNP